ncbi:MAG: hypothetical protein ACOYL3_25575 [Desulfuromonadaceae bacterium]
MPERFQYASDPITSRDTALKNIGDVIGWKVFWNSTKNAVSNNAAFCKKDECNNNDRPGYHVWTTPPNIFGLIFEKGIDGKWRWIELRAD